jgi:hypothetical protein
MSLRRAVRQRLHVPLELDLLRVGALRRHMTFTIMAFDREREHVFVAINITTFSNDEAKRLARLKLAKDERDH